MAILVTGAAGFIGSHLCEHLLRHGEEIVGLDSFDDFYDPATKRENIRSALGEPAFRLVQGDVRDEALLGTLPGEIDTVVHLAARAAARPSVLRPALYADVNVTGTATLLEWARDRSVSGFVLASSSSVYGDSPKVPFAESDPVGRPLSPYGASKRAAELLTQSATDGTPLGTACLRLFTVYGPRQRPDLVIHKFTRLLREGQPIPVFGDGSTSRDYTYVDDAVRGITAAIEWVRANPRQHEIFNIGGDEPIELAHLIDRLADQMGVRPEVERHPLPAADMPRTSADLAKARHVLGYRPSTALEDGLSAFVEWYDRVR